MCVKLEKPKYGSGWVYMLNGKVDCSVFWKTFEVYLKKLFFSLSKLLPWTKENPQPKTKNNFVNWALHNLWIKSLFYIRKLLATRPISLKDVWMNAPLKKVEEWCCPLTAQHMQTPSGHIPIIPTMRWNLDGTFMDQTTDYSVDYSVLTWISKRILPSDQLNRVNFWNVLLFYLFSPTSERLPTPGWCPCQVWGSSAQE